MADWIVGLDLSPTSTGGVIVPVDWAGDWRKVLAFTAGYGVPDKKLKRDREERAEYDSEPATWEAIRRAVIANKIHFETRHLDPLTVQYWIEDGYVGVNVRAAERLTALRAVVQDRVLEGNSSARMVSPSSWRQVLHGTSNGLRAQVKAQTRLVLEAAGCPREWGEDERDAFAVANYGLRERGGHFFTLPAPGVK